jgi:hypothetical protein
MLTCLCLARRKVLGILPLTLTGRKEILERIQGQMSDAQVVLTFFLEKRKENNFFSLDFI